MKGWRGWYHCVLTTYGAWLPGDERGFRTRHHREHVEGDYRDPPPTGMYAERLAAAQQRMKREVVVLDQKGQEVICRALVQKLETLVVKVRITAVSKTHAHLLVCFVDRFRNANTSPGMAMPGLRKQGEGEFDWIRRVVGVAKKHASHELRRSGLRAARGGIWGVRGRIVAITSPGHGKSVVAYIKRHAQEGAVVLERGNKR
ncbi:MAG: hypothetical protein IT443_12775 [Phycisphaeraceae bacterium]|nr:hypothetical protein [Phycisphaeraceae bacterium]